MAHFGRLDQNNNVLQVTAVSNADMLDADGNEVEALGADVCESVVGPGPWVQTSYNNNMRRRYAGVGMAYSVEHDAFLLPKPYPSWVLDLDKEHDWVAPFPKPKDDDYYYDWDEENQKWVAFEKQTKPDVVVLGDD